MFDHKVWLGLLVLWMLFLSGALERFGGSPGVIQAMQLKKVLHSRQMELESIDAEVHALQSESQRLVSNPHYIEREVRKVMGYVAPDEIIFDFSFSDLGDVEIKPLQTSVFWRKFDKFF